MSRRFLMIVAVGTVACSSEQVPPAPMQDTAGDLGPVGQVPPVKDPIGTESAGKNIARLYFSGIIDRRRSVITDSATWSAVWEQVTRNEGTPAPLPEVDFENEVVVLASMGSKPSGGFAIDISSAAAVNGQLRVVVHETSPGTTCAVTGALTAPVHMVRAPRINGPTVFVEETSTRNC